MLQALRAHGGTTRRVGFPVKRVFFVKKSRLWMADSVCHSDPESDALQIRPAIQEPALRTSPSRMGKCSAPNRNLARFGMPGFRAKPTLAAKHIEQSLASNHGTTRFADGQTDGWHEQ